MARAYLTVLLAMLAFCISIGLARPSPNSNEPRTRRRNIQRPNYPPPPPPKPKSEPNPYLITSDKNSESFNYIQGQLHEGPELTLAQRLENIFIKKSQIETQLSGSDSIDDLSSRDSIDVDLQPQVQNHLTSSYSSSVYPLNSETNKQSTNAIHMKSKQTLEERLSNVLNEHERIQEALSSRSGSPAYDGISNTVDEDFLSQSEVEQDLTSLPFPSHSFNHMPIHESSEYTFYKPEKTIAEKLREALDERRRKKSLSFENHIQDSDKEKQEKVFLNASPILPPATKGSEFVSSLPPPSPASMSTIEEEEEEEGEIEDLRKIPHSKTAKMTGVHSQTQVPEYDSSYFLPNHPPLSNNYRNLFLNLPTTSSYVSPYEVEKKKSFSTFKPYGESFEKRLTNKLNLKKEKETYNGIEHETENEQGIEHENKKVNHFQTMNSQATNDLSLMGEVTSSRPYLRPTRPAPPPPTTSLPYSRKNSNAHVNEGNIGRMAIEDYSNLFPIEPKEEEEEEEETPSHKTVSRTSSTYLFNTPPLSRSNSRSSSHSSISPGFFEEFHRKEEETKKAERNAVLEDQILGIENENEHYQELGNENKQHEERGNEQATIHDTKKNSRPRQFKKFLKKFIPKPLKKKKNKRNPNSTADSEDN